MFLWGGQLWSQLRLIQSLRSSSSDFIGGIVQFPIWGRICTAIFPLGCIQSIFPTHTTTKHPISFNSFRIVKSILADYPSYSVCEFWKFYPVISNQPLNKTSAEKLFQCNKSSTQAGTHGILVYTIIINYSIINYNQL
jgi:hypothetical protein